jgi:hypothetical protein
MNTIVLQQKKNQCHCRILTYMSFSRVIFQLVVHVVLCAAKDLFEGELPLTHTYVDGTRV